LEVRVELQTLNKRFLGGNPSIYSLFKEKQRKTKRSLFFLSSPPLSLSIIGTPLPLLFFLVFFIEDNENLKHGGGELIIL